MPSVAAQSCWQVTTKPFVAWLGWVAVSGEAVGRRMKVSAEIILEILDEAAVRSAALAAIDDANFSTDSDTTEEEVRTEVDGDGFAVASRPDFAELFPLCRCGRDDCERCDGFQLTPRTAAVLWAMRNCAPIKATTTSRSTATTR
jgi:hypothetical protein